MSKLLAEQSRLFSEAETVQNEIDAIIEKGDLSDTDKATVATKRAENEKRFGRMTDIKQALEDRKKAAAFSLSSGTANLGFEIPGRTATETARAAENGKFTAEQYNEALNKYVKSNGADRSFAVTTSTGSGMLVPVQVLPPLVVGLDHVIARAKRWYNQEPRLNLPFNDTIKAPALNRVGGKVTQGATSDTITDGSTSDAFQLANEPYHAGTQWFQNTVIQMPGYDVVAAILPALRKALELGKEASFITTSLAGGYTTTALAANNDVTYQDSLNLIESLPAKWQADQASILSATAYAKVLALTSSAGNRLVTVAPDGTLLVKGTPVFKDQTGSLEALGTAAHKYGITFSCSAITLRDNPNVRVNTYTSDQKPDQTGVDLAQDHSFGAAASGVVIGTTS